jgi:excisionase family DNA binding protein
MRNLKSEEHIEYLTVPEIASRLRVTRQAIYQRVRRGDFGTVVRIGSAMRIPAEDFERWLEEHTTKAKR